MPYKKKRCNPIFRNRTLSFICLLLDRHSKLFEHYMLLYREIHFALKKYGSTDFHIFIVAYMFLYRGFISLLRKYGDFQGREAEPPLILILLCVVPDDCGPLHQRHV